ncbi:MAG TPA: ATP phosphoribosyltransferase [Thermoclostridium sp.]|nr:ATP phosphoribosyltransferase [Thermoclostridium sp.]
MRYLTMALPKGRLTEISIELLENAGVDCTELKEKSRKLILTDEKNKIRFFLAKPADVPTYVDYGAADIGIVGKDTLLEDDRDLYEVLNLKFAACRMCVAGPKELEGKMDSMTITRVATKYPEIAKEYFRRKRRESVEIIKLSGSVELAPLVGLSEVIVDLVETGKTLKENGLVVLDTISDISARLIVNRVSMKMESARISNLILNLRDQM